MHRGIMLGHKILGITHQTPCVTRDSSPTLVIFQLELKHFKNTFKTLLKQLTLFQHRVYYKFRE